MGGFSRDSSRQRRLLECPELKLEQWQVEPEHESVEERLELQRSRRELIYWAGFISQTIVFYEQRQKRKCKKLC